MNPPYGGSIDLVSRCSNQITDLTKEIERTHAMGVPFGEHDEPWTLGFHRVVAGICLEVLPTDYARRVAGSFARCEGVMGQREPPAGPGEREDWLIMRAYVGSVAQAISEQFQIEPDADVVTPGVTEDTTPGLFPYGEVAPLVSPLGVSRLRRAAEGVAVWCEQASGERPAESDVEIIRMIAAGVRMADIAAHVGYSRSTLHRRLKQIYHQMGVNDAQGAVYIGGREGWF